MEMFNDSKNKNKIFSSVVIKDKMLNIGEFLDVKIYVGSTNEYIIKNCKIENIYDKGSYNMLLCKSITKSKQNYFTCVNQYKINKALYY